MPLRYRKVTVGVCAMDKKAKSKAMLEILNRLGDFPEFEIITFGDDCILKQPIEQWPKVDALISFFSDRFPLAKVQEYAELRKPFVVNDLEKQWDLLDRRVVYRTLAENDIPVPNHIVVNRNDHVDPGTMPDWSRRFESPGFEEHEDYVELDGKRIDKPFVEKPADAENHNICIYYPHTVGGGYKALFRKVGNQASRYYPPPAPDSSKPYTPVRRDTSFIYEDFMSTGGTDVKVYTIGPNYAHAEARKSPVVDGRVQRDENGKEERFPVLLTPDEKEIARRVCLAFGQTVCGFDLLRTKGRSYVCDVNGWSFVKNSTKYFDDASVCLRAIILQAVAPEHTATVEATEAADQATTEDDPEHEAMQNQSEKSPGEQKKKGKAAAEPPKEELRAVLAVIRHGDRTPKQKMKMRVKHGPLLQLLKKCTGDRPRKQAKLKTPARLQELLNICRGLYSDSLKEGRTFFPDSIHAQGSEQAFVEADGSGSPPLAQARSSFGSKEEWEEEVEQWKQVVSILQEGGHFSGINRKAQLKPLAWEPIPEDQREPVKDGKEGPTERVTQALLILKFGGVLTHLGKNQAEFLGRDFRMRMYPGGDPNSDGLLRLHSTYRHDLKIYSSDEGRVQITAAAFIKGLLDLETENNQLTPILASLVNKDAKLLDFVTHEVEEDILHAKQKLYNIMTEGHVKGKNKNKEYATSDTATYDDFERAGPMNHLRRNSGARLTSPIRMPDPRGAPPSPADSSRRNSTDEKSPRSPKALTSGPSPEKTSNSYALMAADRARSLKAARRSIASSAMSAMSSFRNAIASSLGKGSSDDEKLKSADAKDVPESPKGGKHNRHRSAEDVGATAAIHSDPDGEDVSAPRTSDDNPEQMLGRMDINDPEFTSSAAEDGAPSPPPSPPPAAWKVLEGQDDSTMTIAGRLSSGNALGSVEGSVSRRPHGVPEEPLKLLRLMIDLIQALTRQLREKCFRTNVPTHMGSPTTTTWVDTLAATAPRGSMPKGGLGQLKDGSVPAGGESFLLMHARWKKLEQDIYHPRKGRYDISKVPDVYDAAKYDAIHNSHLDLDGLEELYRISKRLAEGVVPNEYGTHAHSKLRIGGTIAHSLLVKLLQDMFTTRQESFIGMPESHTRRGTNMTTTDTGGDTTDPERSDSVGLRRDPSGDQKSQETAEDEDEDEDEKAIKEEEETELSTTRLNHRYANMVGVHSPHRHVRTRLYFTSESHIHSLLNVLRYCNLEVMQDPRVTGEDTPSANTSPVKVNISEVFAKANLPSLVSHRLDTLGGIGDLDYLTHIVFRMYECFDVPASDPNRFRVEILLSTGIGIDPFKQNVIGEFGRANEELRRKERDVSGSANNSSRRSKDYPAGAEAPNFAQASQANVLPVLQQCPIQNDNAGIVRGPGDIADKADDGDAKPMYLTLNALETYLWKYRRKTPGAYSEISRRELTMNLGRMPGDGSGSFTSNSEWERSNPSPKKNPDSPALKTPKKKDKKKKKSTKSDSDSE